MQILRARIIPFGQTPSAWTSSNPIPYQGEFVFESGATPTDFKFKIGDGLTNYNSLPYQSSGGGGGGGGTLQQTLNLGNSATDLSGGTNIIELIDDATTGSSSYGPLSWVLNYILGQPMIEGQVGFFGGEINLYDIAGNFTTKLSMDADGGLLKLINVAIGKSVSIKTNNNVHVDTVFTNPSRSGVWDLEGDRQLPTLTCTSGSGVATGAAAFISYGDNRKGFITLNTGSAPIPGPSTGTSVLVVAYATPYPTGVIPVISLQCTSSLSVDFMNNAFVDTMTETGFVVKTKNGYTVPASSSFSFSYIGQL